jgi:peptide/nickel transport system substrate-binding protein
MASKLTGVAIALLLLVTSFGIDAGGGTTAITIAASSGGTLTVAYATAPDTLNPAQSGATATKALLRNVFDSLTYVTPDGKVTPWLATSWTISNGGKTYTFHLRHGVTFHDGTPFDAPAVVYNIKYIEAPSTHAPTGVTLLGPYQSITALDKYTVVYTLKARFVPLLAYLAKPDLGIQSPTAIAKYGTQLGVHPIGTGPFEFVSYVRPTILTLKRNPGYNWAPAALHQNGPAKLDGLVFDIITSGNVRVDELQTGQAQLVGTVPPLFYKTLKQNPSYQSLVVPIDGSGVQSFMNTTKWPTNSVAVRQAILYSIDKVGVIKLADAGQYPPTWGPLQQGTIGYDPNLNGMYAYNPAKAAQLLQADGWRKVNGIWTKNNQKLTLQLTEIAQAGDFDDMATAEQGYLQKAGMIVNIQALAATGWDASNTNGTFNVTGPLQFSNLDPDLLRQMLTPGQFFDWSRFNNPTVTKLVTQATQVQDIAKRVQLYWQAQKTIMDQAIMVPIRFNEDLELMSSRVHGVLVTKGGYTDYYTAYLH